MNKILSIVKCCENCAREHTFPRNKREGVCHYLEQLGLGEDDACISRFTICKYYVTDIQKKSKMS